MQELEFYTRGVLSYPSPFQILWWVVAKVRLNNQQHELHASPSALGLGGRSGDSYRRRKGGCYAFWARLGPHMYGTRRGAFQSSRRREEFCSRLPCGHLRGA
eukprot:g17534.t1